MFFFLIFFFITAAGYVNVSLSFAWVKRTRDPFPLSLSPSCGN